MKQITYNEKQKLVLEILNYVEQEFKPKNTAYDFERTEYFNKIQKIKNIYGIKPEYQTLREFINSHSSGAYHKFIFTIKNTIKVDVTSVSDYEMYYNPKFLDEYYVFNETSKSYGSNCCNYGCEHYLELVEKED